METAPALIVREQLTERRARLASALAGGRSDSGLRHLLDEVDTALERLTAGTYGMCESCLEPIESERLIADPLVRFCLDHLPPDEQRALERDLELAARIQRGLLPDPRLATPGWRFAYHYEPARLVSGDYCDLIPASDGALYFLFGDVSGKGVAASMLMAHLHAMMRTLVSIGMPLEVLMERASRLFCESTLPTQYATLVCGRALPDGGAEVCVAGHVPPIVTGASQARLLGAAGLPIGMFCSEQFPVEPLQFAAGDTLMLVTDGVSEAENDRGEEYGIERLAAFVQARRALPARQLIDACMRDLNAHCASSRRADDVTLLALQRER